MANSPSGFIDFNTFYAAQGAAEESAMQKRLEELARLDEESALWLRRGEGEAEMANLDAVRGGGTAGTTLSQTASYGQYLKAQKQAQDLRAALAAAAQGIGNAGLGVRAAANTGATGAVDASAAEQDRLRNYFTQRGENAVASFNRYADETKARAAAAAAAKKAAEDKDKALMDKARANLRKELDDYWRGVDKNAGTFGFTSNYTISGKAGPTDEKAQVWDQRATGLGMDLPRWQLRQQNYTFGERDNKGKEGK